MNATIEAGPLSGELDAPSSKSAAHRLLVCAAFAPGLTDVSCATSSDDIEATASCLEALGARIARTRGGFRVRPVPGTSATERRLLTARRASVTTAISTTATKSPIPTAVSQERSATGAYPSGNVWAASLLIHSSGTSQRSA